jgi:hypothetical protein
MKETVQAQVSGYYGAQLPASQDLKTNACCTDDFPAAHKKILATLEPEVLKKYYGCGVCLPDAVQGCTVLDLGSGSGRNAFVLYGECLSGALCIEDFSRLLHQLGIHDYRVVARRVLTIENEEIQRKTGNITFYSLTVRAFKLALEDQCEDYGQVATYLGIADDPHRFVLDDHHIFETGRPQLVCGNTADMLSHTRHEATFRIDGNKERHFGLFPCGRSAASPASDSAAACGC